MIKRVMTVLIAGLGVAMSAQANVVVTRVVPTAAPAANVTLATNAVVVPPRIPPRIPPRLPTSRR